MWTVCITSIRHVLKLKGYGEPQAKANEKRQRFKGWETLVINVSRRRAVHRSTQRRLPKDKTHCKNTTNILNGRDFQWDYKRYLVYFKEI